MMVNLKIQILPLKHILITQIFTIGNRVIVPWGSENGRVEEEKIE
jgi:hypothetical protein